MIGDVQNGAECKGLTMESEKELWSVMLWHNGVKNCIESPGY